MRPSLGELMLMLVDDVSEPVEDDVVVVVVAPFEKSSVFRSPKLLSKSFKRLFPTACNCTKWKQ